MLLHAPTTYGLCGCIPVQFLVLRNDAKDTINLLKLLKVLI